MKGHGPKHERETIINFNDEDARTTVWTASDMVYRRLLKRLGRAYLTEDGERHAVFTFPSNFLDLPRIKVKKALDPSRRSKLAAQMAAARKLSGAARETGPV